MPSIILATYTLYSVLLNEEFTICGSFAEWTSVDFLGKLVNGFDLFRCHLWSTACTMSLETPMLQQMLVPLNSFVSI
jgi:hypothetical protein